MIPAAAKFQFHMVARLDDTCRFQEADLKPNPQFPFTLLAKMCWSKNVQEERDAPDQLVFGAMDRRYCILLPLGIYLEVWLESAAGAANHFLFGDGDNPEMTKKFLSAVLKNDVWDLEGFQQLASGPIGTHSLRTFPSTFARRCGCSKDDIDSRGRWRKRRVVDRYIDVTLPFPDAKVAAVLCIGGPCKYTLKKGSGVTEDWLCQHVVPNILQSKRFHRQVAVVLALPILWACFDEEMEAYMLPALRNRIRAVYNCIQQLGPHVNPVRKVLLVVIGAEWEVNIDELAADDDNEQQHDGQQHAELQVLGGTRNINDANFSGTLCSKYGIAKGIARIQIRAIAFPGESNS